MRITCLYLRNELEAATNLRSFPLLCVFILCVPNLNLLTFGLILQSLSFLDLWLPTLLSVSLSFTIKENQKVAQPPIQHSFAVSRGLALVKLLIFRKVAIVNQTMVQYLFSVQVFQMVWTIDQLLNLNSVVFGLKRHYLKHVLNYCDLKSQLSALATFHLSFNVLFSKFLLQLDFLLES